VRVEDHPIVALPYDPEEEERDSVAQLVGGGDALPEVLEGLGRRCAGAGVCPERGGAGGTGRRGG
jgi:hypothetical protein